MLHHARRAVAVLALATLGLTGCASSSGGAKSADVLSQVKVSAGDGENAAPKVELTKTPLSATATEKKILKEGKGAVVAKTDIVTVHAVVVNASDGKLIEESFSGPTIGVDLGSDMTFAALRSTLPGAKVGSQVLIAAPPKDALGDAGLDSRGIKGTDTMVFLVDLVSEVTPLAHAEGTEAPADPALPSVQWHPDKAATITIPKDTQAPGDLGAHVLIEGNGPELKSGDHVRVSYTGVLWGSGETFDSSMTRTPSFFDFALGAGKVIPGWDKGLEGKKVGSRLLLVIPPGDGYGAAGQPSSKPPISGTDTLVFVVDILAAY